MAGRHCLDGLCGLAPLAVASIMGLIGATGPAVAQDELNVSIAYVTQEEDRVIPLSLLDTLLPDEGLMGARQAIGNRVASLFDVAEQHDEPREQQDERSEPQ